MTPAGKARRLPSELLSEAGRILPIFDDHHLRKRFPTWNHDVNRLLGKRREVSNLRFGVNPRDGHLDQRNRLGLLVTPNRDIDQPPLPVGTDNYPPHTPNLPAQQTT